MRLRGFIGRMVKVMVVGLLAAIPELAPARAANTPIGNPYGNPRVDFDNLPTPKSASDCDYTWGRTVTKSSSQAKIREELCLRTMAAPHQENFDLAVRDAAIAMLGGKGDAGDIMAAWPIEVRKDIHDQALALTGPKVSSTMPERNTKSDKTAGEKFLDAPHHMSVLSRKKIPQPKQKAVKPIHSELRRR